MGFRKPYVPVGLTKKPGCLNNSPVFNIVAKRKKQRTVLYMSKLSKNQMIVIVVAALYMLSPVDLIPEIILGPLGLVDDAAALTLIFSILYNTYFNKDTSFKTQN